MSKFIELYVFLFFFYSVSSLALEKIPKEWYPLLLAQKRQSDLIKNPNLFYMSTGDPAVEFYDFLYAISSSKSRHQFICRYPARYLLLQNKSIVPTFDFSFCQELNRFTEGFQSKHLSLALTSEYFNAPSSLFGHVMLVFHNDEIPEISATAIHFAALTNEQDNIFAYIKNGLLGGYDGEYIRTSLLNKIFEYNKKEQRFIYFYNLNISEEDIRLIKYYLYELRGIKFKYYFFNNNCADQIIDLLAPITPPKKKKSFIYTLPIEVLYAYKGAITNFSFLPPDIYYAQGIFANLNQMDKEKLHGIIKNNFNNLSDIESSSNKLKHGLFLYNSYLFRKKNEILPNYKVFSNLKFEEAPIKENVKNLDPLSRQLPSKIQVDAQHSTDNAIGLILSFRPVFVGIDNFQNPSMHESTLSIAETKISTIKTTRMEEFKIGELTLLTDYNFFSKNISWDGYLGLNRENTTDTLRLESRGGIGHTYSFFSRKLNVTWLGEFGLSSSKNKVWPFGMPKISFWGYYPQNTKYVFEYEYKLIKGSNYQKLLFTIFYCIKSNITLNINYKILSTKNVSEGIGISYYF